MDLEEAKKVCEIYPDSKVILTHFDSVNHGMFTSKEAREYIKENHLENAIILNNGEEIKL